MFRRVITSVGARTTVPPHLWERRCHGSLSVVTDCEHRPLRPIGMTAPDVARRTGALLMELLAHPGVWIFLGTRPAGTDLPVTPHTVGAGRTLILIESVAWPAGRYEVTAEGRIHCDGVYIGQSAGALVATVRAWRAVLSRRHRVRAVVVVHPLAGEPATLPVATSNELVWAHAKDVVHDVRRLVRTDRAVSRHTLTALMAGSPAANDDHGGRK